MKKFLLAVSLLFIFSKSHAFQIPQDRDGALARSVKDMGVLVYYSTGTTTPFLITGGTASWQGTGGAGSGGVKGSSIAIFGILTSTPPGNEIRGAHTAPGFIELRATDTANSTSELLIPPINVGTWSSTQAATQTEAGDPANMLVVFDPPVIAMDNVSVSQSSNPATPAGVATFAFSVFYRFLATAAPEDVLIPVDESQGEKVHDAGLYGVKPSSNSTSGQTVNDGLGTEGWDFTTAVRTENLASTTTSNLNNNNSSLFYYGWTASTGAVGSFFTCRSTGSSLGTTSNNLLPSIYPRTFQQAFDPNTVAHYNFPWPLQVSNGLQCQASVATERFRHYIRNRRALR